MQVVNRKEKTNAMWRFVGAYLLLIAVTVGVVVNSVSFREVDGKETRQAVERMKKREEAQAKLGQLANILNQLQNIKKPYAEMPPEMATRYDRLAHSFGEGVKNLKGLYFSDTAIYKPHYLMVIHLENNHKEYERTGSEFRSMVQTKVDEEVAKRTSPTPATVVAGGGGGGGSSQAELMVLQNKLQTAQNQVTELKLQLANSGSAGRQLQQLKEKAILVESHLGHLQGKLEEIEGECNGIQKRGDKNLEIKDRIMAKISSMKTQVANLKSANASMVGISG